MSENKLRNDIIDYLLSRGALVLRINSGRRGAIAFVRWFVEGLPYEESGRGVSDIIFLWMGRFGVVEVKIPGNEPTPAQLYFLKKVQLRGGIGLVAESIDDVAEALR